MKKNVLKQFEDWLLRWLTALAWWADVRFEQDAGLVSILVAFIGTFLLSAFIFLLVGDEALSFFKALEYCFHFGILSILISCFWTVFIPDTVKRWGAEFNFKKLYLHSARSLFVISFVLFFAFHFLFGVALAFYVMLTPKISKEEKIRRQTINTTASKN